MNAKMRALRGKVLTVRGPVAPRALGAVMMHEHLHSDIYDWKSGRLVARKSPCGPNAGNT